MTSFSLALMLVFAQHYRSVPARQAILYGRVDEWGYVYLAPTQRQADTQADRPWFFIMDQHDALPWR